MGTKILKIITIYENLFFSYSSYNKILKNLCKSLNLFHNKKEEDNYWEFIISTWLWVYIDALQKRWNIVLRIKKKRLKKL